MTPTVTSRDVQLKSFKKTRLGPRYAVEDVEATMERAEQALRSWEARREPTLLASMSATSGGVGILTADQLLNAVFDPLWMPLRAGYDQEDVDEYLDEVIDALKAWESEASS
ncbi:DivIVA domain-containing protein [Actinomyces sp. zg296]|uniref:DivIVA domain-containing protein n=1 Tax=Actinomyces sp. zg296 TaxID=2609289 RepID=UPI00135A2A94|nr:DivIVA domain-containing protein [Actinomyces sp. zg296]